MDNDRLNDLIGKIKGTEPNSPEKVNDFINQNLSPSQAATFNKILQDPQLISRLLSSDQAKQLFNKLQNKEE